MEKHTLIVTEKPDAAKRIAYALDSQGKPEKCNDNGVPYFIAKRDRMLVIVPAIGHLYSIYQDGGKKSCYPVFDYKWAPRHLIEGNPKSVSKWVEAFTKLSHGADEFISGTVLHPDVYLLFFALTHWNLLLLDTHWGLIRL